MNAACKSHSDGISERRREGIFIANSTAGLRRIPLSLRQLTVSTVQKRWFLAGQEEVVKQGLVSEVSGHDEHEVAKVCLLLQQSGT